MIDNKKNRNINLESTETLVLILSKMDKQDSVCTTQNLSFRLKDFVEYSYEHAL